MIFQYTLDAVLDETKGQTSRIVKQGDLPGYAGATIDDESAPIIAVVHNDRLKWQVGRTYAVQPGRGQKAVARIKMLRIRLMDVREFTLTDLSREGVGSGFEFMNLWIKMHDKPLHRFLIGREMSWTDLLEWTKPQNDHHYQAWVLGFKLEAGDGKSE